MFAFSLEEQESWFEERGFFRDTCEERDVKTTDHFLPFWTHVVTDQHEIKLEAAQKAKDQAEVEHKTATDDLKNALAHTKDTIVQLKVMCTRLESNFQKKQKALQARDLLVLSSENHLEYSPLSPDKRGCDVAHFLLIDTSA